MSSLARVAHWSLLEVEKSSHTSTVPVPRHTHRHPPTTVTPLTAAHAHDALQAHSRRSRTRTIKPERTHTSRLLICRRASRVASTPWLRYAQDTQSLHHTPDTPRLVATLYKIVARRGPALSAIDSLGVRSKTTAACPSAPTVEDLSLCPSKPCPPLPCARHPVARKTLYL